MREVTMPTTEPESCGSPRSACASPRNAHIPGPPTLLLLSLVGAVAAHALAPGAVLVAGWWRALGLVPLAAGGALNLSADAALRRAGTTVKPGLPSAALVKGGVFGITRNPMYLGMVLLLVAVWIALGSATPGAVAVLFAALLDRYFVAPEEEKLQREFGRSYGEYRARVRRWL
jgi:protein-S-isoprenylcysteine O-methyltransferase Ste14